MKLNDGHPNDRLPEGVSPPDEGTMTRRSFIKQVASRVTAVMATAGLGHEIVGGPLWKYLEETPDGHDDNQEESMDEAEALRLLEQAEEKVSEEAHKAVELVNKEYPDLSEREKAMKAIDYLGCAVFAFGVGSLLSGGHIAALHYGMFTAVMTAKYSISNHEEKHHLLEEFKSSAKAGLIIGGTVSLAEGIRADLDVAYEKIASRPLTNTDRVAMLTMLSATVSPAITTVGSATLAKKMAAELANGDTDKAAVLMQYVSNSSGFLLFGDPPFIAVCEKYGFKEGVTWQAQTMWPMAIYSLFSSARKINILRASEEAPEGANKTAWAISETVRGMKNNFPILKSIIAASLMNTLKFFSGADLKDGIDQSQRGLQFEIDKILEEKFSGVVSLFKGQVDNSHHHEDMEGLQGDSPKVAASKEYLEAAFAHVLTGQGRPEEDLKAINEAIQDSNFDEIERLASELGIDSKLVTPLLVAAKKNANGPYASRS